MKVIIVIVPETEEEEEIVKVFPNDDEGFERYMDFTMFLPDHRASYTVHQNVEVE